MTRKSAELLRSSSTNGGRESVDRGALHRRGDVRVDIHRGRDRGVSEALLYDLWVLPRFQQHSGVGVPQAMQGQDRERVAAQLPAGLSTRRWKICDTDTGFLGDPSRVPNT